MVLNHIRVGRYEHIPAQVYNFVHFIWWNSIYTVQLTVCFNNLATFEKCLAVFIKSPVNLAIELSSLIYTSRATMQWNKFLQISCKPMQLHQYIHCSFHWVSWTYQAYDTFMITDRSSRQINLLVIFLCNIRSLWSLQLRKWMLLYFYFYVCFHTFEENFWYHILILICQLLLLGCSVSIDPKCYQIFMSSHLLFNVKQTFLVVVYIRIYSRYALAMLLKTARSTIALSLSNFYPGKSLKTWYEHRDRG